MVTKMLEEKEKFEMHCYCDDTYKNLYGHPENSYYFKTKEDVIKSFTDLINNPHSGISNVEVTINEFKIQKE